MVWSNMVTCTIWNWDHYELLVNRWMVLFIDSKQIWTTLPNLNKFVGLVRLGRVVLCLKALQHKPFGAIYFKSKMRHKNSNRSNFDYKQSNFRNLNPSVSCHKLLTEIHQPLVKPNKIFMSSSWTTPPFDMASCFSASYVDALCYKTQCKRRLPV